MEDSRIKVKVLAMPHEDLKFLLPKNTTIEALKVLIAEKANFNDPGMKWKLVHAGRRLHDKDTLQEIISEKEQNAKKGAKVVLRVYWMQLYEAERGAYTEEQITMKYYRECAYDIM